MARGDAAKKAWALYRAKYGTKSSSSRSRTTASGAAPRRARRRFLGLLGKAGVVVMAVPPIAGSGIAAFKLASVTHPDHPEFNHTLGTRLDIMWRSWLNGLTKGFGLGEPFKSVNGRRVNGTDVNVDVRAADIPSGVWWMTTGAGGVMFVIDRIVAMATKAAVKSPIGGFYLTGR